MKEKNYGHKLAYLANQVGKFFAHLPRYEAVENIEEHLRRYWDPRMRTQILAYIEQGGDGLDELPRLAVEKMALDATKLRPAER